MNYQVFKRLQYRTETNKIKKYFSDKDLIIIAVCILIAASLWFLNALGKTYTTSLYYPVKYVSMPRDKVLSNEPPSKLELKVTANGYNLLRYKIVMTYSPILLNLENLIRNNKQTPDGYIIRTEMLLNNISSQFSRQLNLSSINPDYLVFRFDSLESRIVRIFPVVETTFKPQFNLAGDIRVMPERIQVQGPKEVIDTIKAVYTEKASFLGLDQLKESNLKLIAPQKTKLQSNQIKIEIPVEEFTEKEMMIPISVKYLPSGENIKLFPSSVKVIFLTGLTQFKSISPASFSAVVDYNDVKPGILSLPVSIEKKPKFIQSLKFSPESVEFLIERL